MPHPLKTGKKVVRSPMKSAKEELEIKEMLCQLFCEIKEIRKGNQEFRSELERVKR